MVACVEFTSFECVLLHTLYTLCLALLQCHSFSHLSSTSTAMCRIRRRVEAHVQAKGAGQKPTKFLERFKKIWSLVMEPADVADVVGLTTKWIDVKDQLHRLVAASTLGNRLFGFAIKLILSDLVRASIQETMKAEFAKLSHIGTADVLRIQRLALARLDAIPHISSLPDRRDVTYEYRVLQVAAKVGHVGMEVSLMMHAFVRACAVSCGKLIAVLGENDVMAASTDSPTLPLVVSVDAELVADSIDARRFMNEAADRAKVDDSASLQA